MTRPRKIETENHVKALVKEWFEARKGWSYAPIQNGLGEHGIPDRVGVIPVKVTPEMVGKHIGLFVAVESKAPGRRNEKDEGMTKNQLEKQRAIRDAGGLAVRCDGIEELGGLSFTIAHVIGAAGG